MGRPQDYWSLIVWIGMAQSSQDQHDASRGRALVVFGLLLFSIPLVIAGLRQARFDTAPPVQTGSPLQNAAPENLLVAWSGGRLEDPRIPAFVENLLGAPGPDGLRRGGSPLVASVTTPDRLLTALQSHDVETDEAARFLTGLSLGRGGLKVLVTDAGRRDLTWTAKRLQEALSSDDRAVVVSPRNYGASEGGNEPAIPVQDFDLEILCTAADSPAAIPEKLSSDVLDIRGYPTADEPEGQRLVADAFWQTGSPVTLRVALSEAGRIQPLEAEEAVRKSALAVGVAERDLLIVGKPIDRAARAATLRSIAVGAADQGLAGMIRSPLTLALATAGLLSVILSGFTLESLTTLAVAAFGAATFAATVNALNIAWTGTLLAFIPLMFFLSIASGILFRGEPSSLSSDDSRRRRLLAGVLPLLGTVVIACVSDLKQAAGLRDLLVGAAACGWAFGLATIVMPALESLFVQHGSRRLSLAPDFAAWAAVHSRLVTATACVLTLAAAGALLQPAARDWVAAAVRPVNPESQTFRFERALGGTGDLEVQIEFNHNARQQLRFSERLEIVRTATQRLRECGAVTGAISLADFSPQVEPLASNAGARERIRWLQKSRAVEQQARECAAELGGEWLTPRDVGGETSGEVLSPEVNENWRIVSATNRMGLTSNEQTLHEINLALQSVLRLHAGVDHQVHGDLATAPAGTSIRRPRVVAALLAISVLASAVLLRSLLRGAAVAVASSLPIVLMLLLPGFRELFAGLTAFLGVTIPATAGLGFGLWLIAKYQELIVAGVPRDEALGMAMSQTSRRGRTVLCCSLILALAPLAGATGEFAVEGRLAVLATTWALVSSLVILPFALNGRLGIWFAATPSQTDQPAARPMGPSTVSVRVDSAPEDSNPHFELAPRTRRKRRAG
jgi:hypothetical protein